MNLTKTEPVQAVLVYLYDPIPLDRIGLDGLKGLFGSVTFAADQGMVLAESGDNKTRVQIQSARLEFVVQQVESFGKSDLEGLIPGMLRALPLMGVKSFGINLHVRCTVADVKDGGLMLSSKFLAGGTELEGKLKAKIIASAHRFSYGEPTAYFDVRLTPEAIGGEWIHIVLHRHRDESLTDTDRVLEETVREHDQTTVELHKLLELL
jgi:hypothetical protein